MEMFRFKDHELMNSWGKIKEILSIRAKGPSTLFICLFTCAKMRLLTRPTNAYPELLCAGRNGFHLQGTYSLELNVREKKMVERRK